MIITCDIESFADTILDAEERKKFIEKFPAKKFEWGIQLQTYERWTNKQQRKIWRDLTLYGKEIFMSTGESIYEQILQSKTCPFNHMFVEKQFMGRIDRDGKKIGEMREGKKGLSKFSKEDCIKLIEVMPEYLERMACKFHQEVILFNWSCQDSEEKGLTFCEFTGQPYDEKQGIGVDRDLVFQAVKDEFDGVKS